MEFWPEFLANSWGREFIAGGFGGMAGVISGHPLDTLRVRLQQPPPSGHGHRYVPKPSALNLLRNIVSAEGPAALYRGMAAPLATVAFQNAVVFQVYAVLSRAFDSSSSSSSGGGSYQDPPSHWSIALAGVGTGALQTLILTPAELIKIRLQVHTDTSAASAGPIEMTKKILRREGVRGIYRGLTITMLRDAPAHGVYFWTYEYTRESLHPGGRKSGEESVGTMLVAGGLAGVASWVCCYPLDVVKSRLQAQSQTSKKYSGIVDCFRKSVREEGPAVLWRGLGTAATRAFVVNGAIFAAYETALKCLFS